MIHIACAPAERNVCHVSVVSSASKTYFGFAKNVNVCLSPQRGGMSIENGYTQSLRSSGVQCVSCISCIICIKNIFRICEKCQHLSFAPAGRHVYRKRLHAIPALQRSAMCVMFQLCRRYQKHISDYTEHQSVLAVQDIPL